MLSLEDCIALCGLTEDEVHAIALHENLPEVAAAEMASYLVNLPDGEQAIKAIIRDDIVQASARGDRERAIALKLVLRNYILQHPNCDERCRQELHLPDRRLAGRG